MLALITGLLLRMVSVGAFAQAVTVKGATDPSEPASRPLREVIVSYADETAKLQLYRVNEVGSARRRITDGTHACSMSAWSPDEKKSCMCKRAKTEWNCGSPIPMATVPKSSQGPG